MKRNHEAEKLLPELAEFADALEEFERAYGLRETYEQDVTCPLCGQRELRHTTDPAAPGAVMAVCSKCSEA